MFKPKKEGRLSRRMARCIILSMYSGLLLFTIALIALLAEKTDIFIRFNLFARFLLLIAFILMLLFPCPHCGKPQVAPNFLLIYLNHKNQNHLLGFRSFPAKWKAPNGGLCLWCNHLMEYDDVD